MRLDGPAPIGQLVPFDEPGHGRGRIVSWIALRRQANEDVTECIDVSGYAHALQNPLAPALRVRPDRLDLTASGLLAERQATLSHRGHRDGRQRVVVAGDASRLLQR